MALIECPECGREVSSSAAACPACAYPVATGSAAPDDTSQRRMWRERAKLAAQVAARSLVGVMLIGFGVDGTPQDASTAAVIGGILVAASSIPVWYRARGPTRQRSRHPAPRGACGVDGATPSGADGRIGTDAGRAGGRSRRARRLCRTTADQTTRADAPVGAALGSTDPVVAPCRHLQIGLTLSTISSPSSTITGVGWPRFARSRRPYVSRRPDISQKWSTRRRPTE